LLSAERIRLDQQALKIHLHVELLELHVLVALVGRVAPFAITWASAAE
jgi:hypothetical protein